MLVSIVINNYNYGIYLTEAIDSALNQSYPDKEIIVVDDGSTDRSAEIISSYGTAIKPYFKSNGGQNSAINTGFSKSLGEILIFLDSDDYLTPGAVDALAEPIRKNPSVAKSQGYLLPFGRSGPFVGRTIPRKLSPSGDYRASTLERGPGACRHAYTSGNAWARWFLEQVMPLPEQEEASVDACLSAVSTLFGLVASVDTIVAAYRIHDCNHGPTSATFSRQSLRRLMNRFEFTQEYFAHWAQRKGHTVPVDMWRVWGGSWREGVLKYSLSSLEGSPRRVRFEDLVLSSFKSGQTMWPKALVVSALLTLLWLLPRNAALALARRMLKLPKATAWSDKSTSC